MSGVSMTGNSCRMKGKSNRQELVGTEASGGLPRRGNGGSRFLGANGLAKKPVQQGLEKFSEAHDPT